jgi:ATP-dependent exoDNAse (exonuclease V) beta subunit
VLSRPDNDPARSHTVCPGLHTFGADANGYSVVWWSPEPGVLALDAQAPLGLRRDDLIVKDVAPAVLSRYLDAYTAWHAGRKAAIDAASTPSIEVMTATEAASRAVTPAIAAIDVRVEEIAGASERPGGTRFGALVHALLADVPHEDTDGVVAQLATAHGRVLGAEAEEIEAAVEVVERVLAHPLWRDAVAAAAAGQCYRETPITLRLEAGVLIEGNVDLAYERDGAILVIDFKTDRELQGTVEVYRRQVQIYAHAIALATGKPARGVLLKI